MKKIQARVDLIKRMIAYLSNNGISNINIEEISIEDSISLYKRMITINTKGNK